jgi:hypothetical protein
MEPVREQHAGSKPFFLFQHCLGLTDLDIYWEGICFFELGIYHPELSVVNGFLM